MVLCLKILWESFVLKLCGNHCVKEGFFKIVFSIPNGFLVILCCLLPDKPASKAQVMSDTFLPERTGIALLSLRKMNMENPRSLQAA